MKYFLVIFVIMLTGCVTHSTWDVSSSAVGIHCKGMDVGVDNPFRPSHTNVAQSCVDDNGNPIPVTTEYQTGTITSIAGPFLEGGYAGNRIGDGLRDSGDNIGVTGGNQIQGQAQGQIQGQKQKSVGGCQGNCD